MSGGAVSARLCAGEQLERLDKSVAGVTSGEIGFAHFAYIANASAKVGERLDETTLLRHARKESVAKFRETCIHARHAADPEGVVEEEVEGVEMRELTLTDTDDGMVSLSGVLDKVGGAALRTALEPLAKRMGKDDRRRCIPAATRPHAPSSDADDIKGSGWRDRSFRHGSSARRGARRSISPADRILPATDSDHRGRRARD
ncbi:MAG: DUF222 domain-containing protein, partial [Chloroflexi bacterium]